MAPASIRIAGQPKLPIRVPGMPAASSFLTSPETASNGIVCEQVEPVGRAVARVPVELVERRQQHKGAPLPIGERQGLDAPLDARRDAEVEVPRGRG